MLVDSFVLICSHVLLQLLPYKVKTDPSSDFS